ncbi:MAG: Linear gramicidin synthase subunit D [Verrucomicrobiae bacterium]|nr:Linear gramicidin synthase subunit D [Verrucomicrobiae bacterium]
MTLDQLVAKLREQNITLWVEGDRLRYRAAPEAVTPELLATLRERKTELIDFLRKVGQGNPSAPPAIPRLDRTRPLPLSFAQERLCFLDRFEPNSPAFNIPVGTRLTGPLNETALRQALQAIVDRHEALRTNLEIVDGLPAQRIVAAMPVELPVVDLTGMPEAEVMRRAELEAQRPFQLATECKLRATLFRVGATEHWLVMNLHHIAADGWSLGIVFRELAAFYESFVAGKPAQLPALPIQYADYGAWQREWLQGETLDRQMQYWRHRLANAPALLELPTDKPRPAVLTQAGSAVVETYPPAVAPAVAEFSRLEGVSPFMTLLAAFQVLLHRYSRQDDILVGTPMACRNRTEIEGLIGFFVNTVVMRENLAGNPSFRELVRRGREATLEALAHQELPFEKLVEELKPERNLAHAPVFQVLFTANNFERTPVQMAGVQMTPVEFIGRTAKYDLTLYWQLNAQGLAVTLEYATDLFEADTMRRMLGHYRTLVESLVARPEAGIETAELLPASERRQVLEEWNATQAEYPTERCVHELVEAQVARTPDAVAVVCGKETLTYRELNERADRLAGHLAGLGLGPGQLAGIYVERSLDMLVGLLGVLKAGGAYLPLDPSFPAERLAFMVADARPVVILTQQKLAGSVPAHESQVVILDALTESTQKTELRKPQSTDLAYVLYTSGSTGKPKGVQIPHRAVVNFLLSMQREPGLSASDVLVAVTTLSFDIAGLELYLPLVTGARVVIASRVEAADPERLLELLTKSGATVLQATPVTWRLLVGAGWNGTPKLKVLCGGEALPVELAEQLVERSDEVWNLYGPTETTIWSAVSRVLPNQALSLGRPIANTDFYVLDALLQPVPVGVPGELLIGGAGVARGYLNRPELTAEKFIAHPFRAGERLYRTGDLVRYRGDGTVEFLGRLDHQVKIRGFRIELGEIETALGQLPAVRQAVVIAREDEPGEKRLVAYLLGTETPESELRAFLKERVPDYMVPAAFVWLEKYPLTPNGKVDRKALPAPAVTAVTGTEYVAPRTEWERQLVAVWERIFNRQRIGVRDNFFELGGHSLLALRLMAKVEQLAGAEVPLLTLFQAPTVEQLAAAVQPKAGAVAEERPAEEVVVELTAAPVDPASVPVDPRPLSYAQERLWFLDQLEPNTATYNIVSAVELTGPLNVEALRRSFALIFQRHEALRTTFDVVDGKPAQRIAPPGGWELPVEDVRGLPAAEVQRRANAEAQRPFVLARDRLLRTKLFRAGDQEHLLVIVLHHIVSDGWSIGVLYRELGAAYAALAAGRAARLPVLRAQYAEFAVGQREWLRGPVLEQQLNFWRNRLAGAPVLLDLPTDRPRPPAQTYRGDMALEIFPVELLRRLQELSRAESASLFMILLAAFEALLARYTRQEDILIGTPTACRSRADVENLIGLFVNTVVMRADLSGNPTFRELVAQTRAATLAALAHQELPFEKLVEELQVARNLAHSPLFQVMFVAINEEQVAGKIGGLQTESRVLSTRTAKFDLTLYWEATAQGLVLSMEYNTDLFEAATIRRMLGHYRMLLEGFVANPAARVGAVPLLTALEQNQLAQWNATEVPYPQDVCLHQLFEAQVERTPDTVAVVFEGQQLTYRELDARANQLARHLLTLGVQPDNFVGVYMERSVEMVVALYATLKAGAAYVPIDPTYPADRVAFMLNDAQPPVLLTQEKLVATLPAHQARVVIVGRELTESTARPVTKVNSRNLAYMIYTSGSTGKPKGAMNEHRGIVNRLLWMQDEYRLGTADRVLQKTPFSFDVSVWEFFWPLLTGARLIVAKPEGHRDTEYLVEVIRQHGITTLHFVPSMLAVFLTDEKVGTCRSLRRVICSGEALGVELQESFFAKLPGVELHNLYGPTEAAVDVTYWACRRDSGLRTVPIGRPIANIQMHILDAQLLPVPVGVAGELHIAGIGLGRGYWNRPELTAEKFLPNPFRAGERLYKTGDLARYLPDGNIEYLGRLDHQVKIRGFRIELGEIEVALGQHPAVREVVIVAREDVPGDKRLVAFLVANGAAPSVAELRAHLLAKLPEYMLPAAFVFLPAMPLSPNGKIDRRLLPAPDPHRPDLARAVVAPRTPAEKTLAEIWAKVLRLDVVGIHDKFFELGGDSILSIHVIAKANQAGLKLTPKQIFQHQTIAELAAVAGTSVAPASEQGAVMGEVPLTPIQRWFVAQNHVEPHHWNQAQQLETHFAPDVIEAAVQRVVAQHDALRLRFANGRQFHAPVGEPVTVARFGGAEYEMRLAELQASLDLANGPIFRVAIFEFGDKRRVLWVIHHLAVDGVSWQILWEDLEAACRGAALPAKTTSFQSWARRLAAHSIPGEVEFWRASLTGCEGTLPVDFADGANTEGSVATVEVALPAAETTALLQEAPRAYRTQINDLLLAALARALGRWCGRSEALIDLEGHGREELFADVDLSRTVGWFTTLFPVALRFDTAMDDGAFIKSVKEQLRAIPHRGLGYGLVREQLAGLPEPRVIFNYLGQAGKGGAQWAGGPSRSPRTHRTHLLEINGLVTDGELRLGWNFSGNVFRRETVAAVAADFARELRGLVEHCRTRTVAGATPTDFPLAKLSQVAVDGLLERYPDLEDVYRLSPMQQLFYSVANPAGDVGFEQWCYTVRGALDAAAFRRAWQTVLDRHAALRTLFVTEGLSEPHQVVRRQVTVPVVELDWRTLDGKAQERQWTELLASDRTQGFALTEAPLMRLTVVRLAEAVYRVVWTHHHLLMDGWSWPLVLQEVAAVYAGKPTALPPSRAYRNYIAWLQQQDLGKAEAFWRKALAGLKEPTPLPVGGGSGTGPGAKRMELTETETAAVQEMARELGVTVNAVVQTAWALWLSRSSGRQDVAFGAAVSGRPAAVPGVESIVGMLINNLPVHLRVAAAEPVGALLRRQQGAWVELQEYEFTPLLQVQEWSEVPWQYRLFESLIVFQNYVAGGAAEHWLGPGLQVESLHTLVQSNYQLALVVAPGPRLGVEMIYPQSTFAAATITETLAQLRTLLVEMPARVAAPVGELLEKLPAPVARATVAGKKAEYVAPRDPLEQQLAKLWEQIFGISPIGIQDNFFALGGHSLLAVRLFPQIEKLTGKNLPMVTLFQAPTVEKLAAVLRQEGWTPPWQTLVPIKAGGSKPPFYCVHGVGGNILEYLDLAKYMDDDQPFYGIQAVGLDGKQPWLKTIEEQAAHHIGEIRAFQPTGPYYLGGSSYGGLVAYEMAQQLHRAGEAVALLAFFDTAGPGYPQPLDKVSYWQKRWDYNRYRFALHWGNFQAASGAQKLEYVREKTKRLSNRMVWYVRRYRARMKKRVAEINLPKVIAQTKKVGEAAATRYVLKPYPGKAVLFRATHQPPGIRPDPTLGWGPYVLGGLEFYDTPGHHGAIVRDPRAQKLAEQLMDALSKAQVTGAARG